MFPISISGYFSNYLTSNERWKTRNQTATPNPQQKKVLPFYFHGDTAWTFIQPVFIGDNKMASQTTELKIH